MAPIALPFRFQYRVGAPLNLYLGCVSGTLQLIHAVLCWFTYQFLLLFHIEKKTLVMQPCVKSDIAEGPP